MPTPGLVQTSVPQLQALKMETAPNQQLANHNQLLQVSHDTRRTVYGKSLFLSVGFTLTRSKGCLPVYMRLFHVHSANSDPDCEGPSHVCRRSALSIKNANSVNVQCGF